MMQRRPVSRGAFSFCSPELLARRNKNVAAVALAAKNARIAWALLAHERGYQHDYVATRKAA